MLAYPPDAVLEIHDVADWLHISTRQVERLQIPCFFLGTRTRRWLAKDVITYMEKLKFV